MFIYVSNNWRSSGSTKADFGQFFPNDNMNIMKRQIEWLEITQHLNMLSETIQDSGIPSIQKSSSRIIAETDIYWILYTIFRKIKIDYKFVYLNERLGEKEDPPGLCSMTQD